MVRWKNRNRKKERSVDDSVFEIITIGSTIVIVLTSIYGISLWVIIKHINDKVKKTVAEKAKVEIKHIEKWLEIVKGKKS